MPALLGVALLLSCAHARIQGDADAARKTADLFHHRVRWRDFGGATLLLVPEKRAAFDEARRTLNDERDLSISDYQLDELQLAESGTEARVVSRMSWYRLPSVSTHEDTVVTELVYQNGAWLISRQQGGPFDEELSGPYHPASPAAGSTEEVTGSASTSAPQ